MSSIEIIGILLHAQINNNNNAIIQWPNRPSLVVHLLQVCTNGKRKEGNKADKKSMATIAIYLLIHQKRDGDT